MDFLKEITGTFFDLDRNAFSGAMDIIAVRLASGEMKSTPFAVHFGKFRILKNNDCFVRVFVNENQTDLTMHISEEGQCFFSANDLGKVLLKLETAPKEDNEEEKSTPGSEREINENEHEKHEKQVQLEEDHQKEEAQEPLDDLTHFKVNPQENLDNSKGILTPNNQKDKEKTPSPLKQNASVPLSERLFCPSSRILESLGLNDGENKIRFQLNKPGQNPPKCELTALIFLYCQETKLVISDIDGTITKSNIRGHLLPIIKVKWAHQGVAEMLSKIKRNGYEIVYLTARPIGRAIETKEYLEMIREGHYVLPRGPLILSNSSYWESFKKKVIEKKSMNEKLKSLNEIQSLFGKSSCLFGGFGNEEEDLECYRQSGCEKMFIISKDVVLHSKNSMEKKGFSNYLEIIQEIEKHFPKFLKEEKKYVEKETIKGETQGSSQSQKKTEEKMEETGKECGKEMGEEVIKEDQAKQKDNEGNLILDQK